jgi:hypothetical protein
VETVPAEFHGAEPGIAFNPHYLLDGLAAAGAPVPARAKPGGTETGGPAAPDANPGADGAAPPTDPGLLRIEFTSPAKPALITRVPPEPAQDDQAGEVGPPGFRYLVVPLRAVTRS